MNEKREIPRIDEDGGVVVPVEEDERLFAQHDENRVAQFRHFRQDEHGGPESGDLVAEDVAEFGRTKREID